MDTVIPESEVNFLIRVLLGVSVLGFYSATLDQTNLVHSGQLLVGAKLRSEAPLSSFHFPPTVVNVLHFLPVASVRSVGSFWLFTRPFVHDTPFITSLPQSSRFDLPSD